MDLYIFLVDFETQQEFVLTVRLGENEELGFDNIS